VSIEAAQAVLDVLDGRASTAAVNAPLASQEAADALAPYLSLATTLGQLLRQVSPSGVGEVVVELGRRAGLGRRGPARRSRAAWCRGPGVRNGSTSSTLARSRTAAAFAFAERRRQDVATVGRIADRRDAGRSAWKPGSAPVSSSERLSPIAGTIANGRPRLTRLGRFDVDLPPSAEMLVISITATGPARWAGSGSCSATQAVNIGQVHLARDEPLGDALMVLDRRRRCVRRGGRPDPGRRLGPRPVADAPGTAA
jgi:D-3-phosphoglycerate dehydrogenase